MPEERPDQMDNSGGTESEDEPTELGFYGGNLAVGLMILAFLGSILYIVWIGAAGSTSFWAAGVLALFVGGVLAKNQQAFSEAVINGIGREMVGVMVAAWLLAGILGSVLAGADTPGALIYVASLFGDAITGRVFVVVTFVISSVIATAIGTGAGTVLAAGPVFFPAGVLLGANPVLMGGAILSGAAFGDDYAPISDTTIVAAYTQETDISGCIRSRLKYVLVAAVLAIVLFLIAPAPAIGGGAQGSVSQVFEQFSRPDALPMLIPAFAVIGLALYGMHLITILIFGNILAIAVAVGFGLMEPSGIVSYEDVILGNPGGAVITGIQDLIGVIIFAMLVMAIYGVLEESGAIDDISSLALKPVRGIRSAELSIVGVTLVVNLITALNSVTLLAVGEIVNKIGTESGINEYRRANLLDLAGNSLFYTLPWMLAPLLMVAVISGVTEQYPVAVPTPIQVGLYTFHSWMLLLVVLGAIATGFGRTWAADDTGDWWGPAESEPGPSAD